MTCQVKESSSALTAAAQRCRHLAGLRTASPHAAPGTPHRRAPGFRRASGEGLPAPSRGGCGPRRESGRRQRGEAPAGACAAGPGRAGLPWGGVRELRLLTAGSEARAAVAAPAPPAALGAGASPSPRSGAGPALLLRGLSPFNNMSVRVTVLFKNNVLVGSA